MRVQVVMRVISSTPRGDRGRAIRHARFTGGWRSSGGFEYNPAGELP
jgi:hypothetical protein